MAPGLRAGISDERCYQSTRLLVRAGADPELVPIRRGEDQAPTSCDILTPMGSPSLVRQPPLAALSWRDAVGNVYVSAAA